MVARRDAGVIVLAAALWLVTMRRPPSPVTLATMTAAANASAVWVALELELEAEEKRRREFRTGAVYVCGVRVGMWARSRPRRRRFAY